MKKLLLLLLLSTLATAQQSTVPAMYSGNLTSGNASCLASNCLTVPVVGSLTAASIQLTGTWSGTVQFEASVDGGATWNSLNGIPLAGGSLAISTAVNGVWAFNIAGNTHLRARSSTISSGTAVVNITLSPGTSVPNQPDFSNGNVSLSAASADCSVNSSCVSLTVRGFGTATITVHGTYTGSTIVFEFSDDNGTTWFQDTCTRTDANIQEGSEVLPSNQTRAWDCGIAAATNFRIRQSAISTGSTSIGITLSTASIEPAPTVSLTNTPGVSDPCLNPGVLKSSVSVSITSATTTQLVALAAGQKVYICGGFFTVGASGTSAASAVLEYGTGASCGTGTTALTGAMGTENTTATNGPLPVTLGNGLSTASGNALCLLSAGTTVAIHGYISFVQQ